MGYTGDEVAGVVEVFGALTRAELREALAELSYRTSGDADEAGAGAAVEDALASYHLVPVGADPELLVAGPAAFPTLPTRADDLPQLGQQFFGGLPHQNHMDGGFRVGIAGGEIGLDRLH